jgi:hypothetical protein
MRVRVVWWELDGSKATIAEMPLPSRARELIGKDPDFEEWFDLEASVEGAHSDAPLSRRAAVFAGA